MTCRFGIQLAPTADDLENVCRLARLADREGLDLLGVQDHPYAPGQLDAFAVITAVLVETERLWVFPDVANLALRGPAMLAKIGAALDRLSGGRFDLGLGAGGFAPAIRSMGGPDRSGREALEALEEGSRSSGRCGAAGSGSGSPARTTPSTAYAADPPRPGRSGSGWAASGRGRRS